MTLKTVMAVLAALIIVLLAYAWIDGGEESVRPIAQTVAVPDSVATFTPEPTR